MEDAIFLSAGVPDPKRGPEFARTADSVAIAAAVSALVYVALGRRPLVWGGHPAITPIIWTAADDFSVDYGRWVRLYQSNHFKDEFPEDNDRFKNVIHTKNIAGDREKSLHEMREKMLTENKFSAAVFIGGMAGIVQEFEMFRNIQPHAAIVPILSAGGAALTLGDKLVSKDADLSNDLDYVGLLHRKLNIDSREKRYNRPEDQPQSVTNRYWKRSPRK